jgi:DNA polymerase I-like protein with 3'-5' exonuclease and polymerase domains/uracil-DNA glycosylase
MPSPIYPKCDFFNNCPLNNTCSRTGTELYFPDGEEKTVDVMFIGDHSWLPDFHQQRPFVGPEGTHFLRPLLKKYLSDTSYALAYLVRGWPVDKTTLPPAWRENRLQGLKIPDYVRTLSFANFKHQEQTVNMCSPYLFSDIEKLQPKKLILLGSTVFKTLFPKESRSASSLQGETLVFKGIPTKIVMNPGVILRNPSLKEGWESSFISAVTDSVQVKNNQVGPTNVLTKIEDVRAFIETLKESPIYVGLDTETKNLNKRYGNALACIQFSETPNSSVVIPYAHPDTPFDTAELEEIKNLLFDLFAKPNKIKAWVCHNAKFECNILKQIVGTTILSAPIFDTQVGAFLLDENRADRVAQFKYGIYSLKQLAYDYLRFDGYDKGVLAVRDEGNLWDLSGKDLFAYGGMDTQITVRLMHAQLKEAERQNYKPQLLSLMYDLYTPFIKLFCDIEQSGMYVNKQYLRTLVSGASPILTQIQKLKEDIKELPEIQRANDYLLKCNVGVGKGKVVPLGNKPWVFDFSKGGHAQLLFFDIVGLKPAKYGKSGVPSVDAAWQEQNNHHPLVQKFIEWQELRMMFNTFAKKIYGYIDPVNGSLDCNTDSRIRPNYLLSSVVTGRIACREPNLHSVPRSDSPVKKLIKNMFQAEHGEALLQLDYKANEIRWAGILSQDETLAQAILVGEEALTEYRKDPRPELLEKAEIYGDIHKQVASMIYEKELAAVTKDERQAAKACSFGILYDSSMMSMAKSYDKTVEEIADWFERYFARFPKVKIWKQRMKDLAKYYSYVETPHGRRRRFPIFDLYRANGTFDENRVAYDHRSAVAEALRQSSNAPIQGIASDAGMLGAAFFAEEIRNKQLPIKIQNVVHDSCVFSAPLEFLPQAVEIAEQCFLYRVMEHMTQIWDINFILPLGIDFEIGTHWGDLEKWNFNPQELQDIIANIKEKQKASNP